MKGTILRIAPNIQIVDVTHAISPQDVMEAAHILTSAAQYFPADTVHLVVVDPEVGTNRRGIALSYGGQFFVGPDNGLFSLLMKQDEPDCVVELNRPAFWRSPDPSSTFHGRDIFAPVAAHLASGTPLLDLGSIVTDLRAMRWALPISDSQGIQGWVVHVDGFGNCITNITRASFDELLKMRPFKCYVGNAIVDTKHVTYADAPPGDSLLLFNSDDELEVAINRGNASQMFDIRKGASVNIVFIEEKQADGNS